MLVSQGGEGDSGWIVGKPEVIAAPSLLENGHLPQCFSGGHVELRVRPKFFRITGRHQLILITTAETRGNAMHSADEEAGLPPTMPRRKGPFRV
jgi:hypothetical protein